jgi:hypothetical protein
MSHWGLRLIMANPGSLDEVMDGAMERIEASLVVWFFLFLFFFLFSLEKGNDVQSFQGCSGTLSTGAN